MSMFTSTRPSLPVQSSPLAAERRFYRRLCRHEDRRDAAAQRTRLREQSARQDVAEALEQDAGERLALALRHQWHQWEAEDRAAEEQERWLVAQQVRRLEAEAALVARLERQAAARREELQAARARDAAQRQRGRKLAIPERPAAPLFL